MFLSPIQLTIGSCCQLNWRQEPPHCTIWQQGPSFVKKKLQFNFVIIFQNNIILKNSKLPLRAIELVGDRDFFFLLFHFLLSMILSLLWDWLFAFSLHLTVTVQRQSLESWRGCPPCSTMMTSDWTCLLKIQCSWQRRLPSSTIMASDWTCLLKLQCSWQGLPPSKICFTHWS